MKDRRQNDDGLHGSDGTRYDTGDYRERRDTAAGGAARRSRRAKRLAVTDRLRPLAHSQRPDLFERQREQQLDAPLELQRDSIKYLASFFVRTDNDGGILDSQVRG